MSKIKVNKRNYIFINTKIYILVDCNYIGKIRLLQHTHITLIFPYFQFVHRK